MGECSESDGEDDDTERSPGQRLVSQLLTLHLQNKLSASDCCTAMWWASQAGVVEAKAYALPPESSSGHCSRKLKSAMGFGKSSDLYELEVPGHNKHELSRGPQKVWALPAHEQLAADLASDGTCLGQIQELRRSGDLPPAYWDHPVVKQHAGQPVWPVALYIDAVPFSQNDSVLGFWLVCLVTGRRYCWGLLRKSVVCSCGCRGWDSFYVFWHSGHWSLAALDRACFPGARHDGTEWRPTDSKRQGLAGTSIPMPCACLYIKGDWGEFAGSLGLPPWNDSLRPCYLCNVSGPAMFTAAGNTEASLRWQANAEGDYDCACDRCSRVVRIPDGRTRDAIGQRLEYDKRQHGSHGRSLTQSLDELKLHDGDRLEPSAGLTDVGELENLAPPASVVFWRPSSESMSRHRNPIFSTELGLDPARCLTVDILHAMHLGVLKVWAKTTLWAVLLSGIYGQRGTAEEQMIVALMALRSALMAWYKTRHQEYPNERLTRLNDLTPKMVGAPAAQCLKTKGAETYGLMKFLLSLLRMYTFRIGPDWQRLLQAGEALDDIIGTWQHRRDSWTIPEAERTKCMDLYVKHVALMAPFACYTPKHHIVLHLLFNVKRQGNPMVYATWLDESLNKLLKASCKNASATTFYPVVLLKMRELLRLRQS